ncbi:MAG: M28 family peptidase [Phycisphaerae bacterium]|nr:M28 family peptidase [Gemmatimonadaceae bacterium]
MTPSLLRVALLALSVAATAPIALLSAQSAPPAKAPNATPIPADSYPSYVRRNQVTDTILIKIWNEGMVRGQAAVHAQVLLDSIGARLTGSPNMERAQDWLIATYSKWGIAARKEQYGTWNSWKRGASIVQLTAPRFKMIENTAMSWSGNTGSKWVEGEVIRLQPYNSDAAFSAWLPSVKGKIVLASAPRISCRMPEQIAQFAQPGTQSLLASTQDGINAIFAGMTQLADSFYVRLKQAGALAVFELNWSNYPGISRVFGSPRNSALPSLEVGCEDYSMLYRLAHFNQGPHVRLMVESEALGERPVFNVIGEIKGQTKPNEYVVLSAHFDSWEGHSGATDNGTGTVTMLEAMRLLKLAYPKPARTILVGHWSGEEQGINGSGSFAEDHPEIVAGLQFTFNQDNGTGRIVSLGPTIFPENGPRLAKYLSAIPSEITRWIRMQPPAAYSAGSDHVPWLCRGAPALNLNALSWDYSYTTWHTNRDSFDKVVFDDLINNATLAAMLAYLASEDPERSSRVLMNPMPNIPGTQTPLVVPNCAAPLRNSAGYRR